MPADEIPNVEELGIEEIKKTSIPKTPIPKKVRQIKEENKNNYTPPKTKFYVLYKGEVYELRVIRPMLFPGAIPEYQAIQSEKDGSIRIYVKYYSKLKHRWKWVIIQKMTPVPKEKLKHIIVKRRKKVDEALSKMRFVNSL